MTQTTYNTLPESVDDLRQQVAELCQKFDLLLSSEKKPEPNNQRKPIRIEAASEITGLSVPTLYVKARNGQIKSYKSGKFILFFEEDLLEYVKKGRRKTTAEILETAEIYSLKRY